MQTDTLHKIGFSKGSQFIDCSFFYTGELIEVEVLGFSVDPLTFCRVYGKYNGFKFEVHFDLMACPWFQFGTFKTYHINNLKREIEKVVLAQKKKKKSNGPSDPLQIALEL